MKKTVRVAMVQDNFLVGDIKGNADKIINLSRAAKSKGADLVMFPELALVGYPPEDLLYRPGFNAQVVDQLARIQSQLNDIDVLLGMPDRVGEKLYNAAVWLRNGERIASYHKQALPNYSVFDEARYFKTDSQSVVVEFKGVKFGLAICEDVWEKQSLADAKAAGAEVMLVLNASPYHVGKYEERLDVLAQRGRENHMPILYLNMVGGQDELVFDGESLVVNGEGKPVSRAPAFETFIDYVDVTASQVQPVEKRDVIALREDEAIYKALVLGVRDYVYKNGFIGVVIGLSGGVDSALTLAIAVDALGADHVHAVMMPTKYTADMSLEDARAEAEILSVQYDIIPIESVFEEFLSLLAGVFAGKEADATEENIQARCRGVILMAISNKTGRMLLTTGNKSEMAVGYTTLYGDMSGGFAPLKDVSKTRVYQLCRYRNALGNVIPERVLTRPPSAELRADQCDQDFLPDYDVLDRILELSVERDMPMKDIIAMGLDKSVVEQVTTMVQRNEYKRRQAAPGVRITRRAFGRDRRYPITSGYRRNL
ncbi:MAG: NAD+ synthase [Gammaproteobacteria bacterium]|nr:NAD+ synthase [Gammaproteobacteria bacterium]